MILAGVRRRGWRWAMVSSAVAGLTLVGAIATPALAQITREESLALAFPGATIRAERVFLTDAQRREASVRAGVDVESALVARYVASDDGVVRGRAYVDTHVVRTKRESLLIAIDSQGRVRRIDVTAFLEPSEYAPPRPWLEQYDGRPLSAELNVNRVVRPLAGATLTARAVNEAVRRVLAIDAVLGTTGGR